MRKSVYVNPIIDQTVEDYNEDENKNSDYEN